MQSGMPRILVIDMGSQYTLVIGRTLREAGFRSIISSPVKAAQQLRNWRPAGIILSGGSASVYEENAPQPPEGILEMNIPILGICYGMQWIAWKLGGSVVRETGKKEYGPATVSLRRDNDLLKNVLNAEVSSLSVWASHGDSIREMPTGFISLGESTNRAIAAIGNQNRNIWGLQFHPEVTQTDLGKYILRGFASSVCGCEADWDVGDVVARKMREASETIGDNKAIIGFSGGVDSTAASALLAKVLGKNLLAVCIDTGGLREFELEEIKRNAQIAGIVLKVVKASGRFFKALGQTSDAETKRRRFKRVYGRILEEEAIKFGAKFIIQGTLATDIIESGKAGESALIKSHHNVGLKLRLEEHRPFSDLFKYEVRDLARKLGLPESISGRHPFPGPGLFVRIIGKPVTQKRVNIVRWADARVREILEKHEIYADISQLIVALCCVNTVGVKGDGRVYSYAIIVRGVKTMDFMTLHGYQIPESIRREITQTVTRHEQIVRVWYDETDKPPATTEME